MKPKMGHVAWALVNVLFLSAPAFATPLLGLDDARTSVGRTCTVESPMHAPVTLNLSPSGDLHWASRCARLADYLDLPPAPLTEKDAQAAERALVALEYFQSADCATNDGALHCALEPAKVVRKVSLRGKIPLALLKEDSLRRISLRPGTTLLHLDEDLARQKIRLERYFESEGYFDANIKLTTELISGAEPQQGVHLIVSIEGRASVVLRQVEILGDIPIPRAAVERIFRHQWFIGVPQRFRPIKLADDAAQLVALFNTYGYPTARVETDYTRPNLPDDRTFARLRLRIFPGQRLKLNVEGNHAISTKRLLKEAPFARLGAIDSVAIEEYRLRLLEIYQGRGFADVAIRIERQREPGGSQRLIIYVEEGTRTKVSRVEVRWAETDAPSEAMRPLSLLNETTKRLLTHSSRVLRPGRIVDSQIAHDSQVLEGGLRDAGCMAPAVDVQLTQEDGRFLQQAVFTLTCGTRQQVEGIYIEGIESTGISSLALKSRLALKEGGAFTESKLSETGEQAMAVLIEHGFAGAGVEPNARVTPTGVAIDLKLTPGSRAHLGGLFVRGNFRTHTKTLASILSVAPGSPLDVEQLGAARRELRSMGIFDTVSLAPLPRTQQDANMWLMLAVEEREVRTLDSVLSFSSDYRFSIGADYRDRNLFGRTMALTSKLRLSNASLALPKAFRIGNQDLFETRLSAARPLGAPFDVDVTTLYRFTDVLEYQERRIGGVVTLSRVLAKKGQGPLGTQVTGRVGYELAFARRPRFSAIHAPSLRAPNIPIGRLIPGIGFEGRDSIVDPTRGFAADVRLELAHPDLALWLRREAKGFVRAVVVTQGVLPLAKIPPLQLTESLGLGGRVLLSQSIQYSIAHGLWGLSAAQSGVPPSETFAYGGDFSVRGLQTLASNAQLDVAEAMVVVSHELRVDTLVGLGSGAVQLAGFVDIGTVARTSGGLFAQTTVSVGPALRYATPIGPLSLARGWAVVLPNALKGDETLAPRHGRWHLTFGTSF